MISWAVRLSPLLPSFWRQWVVVFVMTAGMIRCLCGCCCCFSVASRAAQPFSWVPVMMRMMMMTVEAALLQSLLLLLMRRDHGWLLMMGSSEFAWRHASLQNRRRFRQEQMPLHAKSQYVTRLGLGNGPPPMWWSVKPNLLGACFSSAPAARCSCS